jgi:hypothetical protein
MLLRAWEQSADGHSSLTVHSTSTRTSVHPPASSGKAGIGRRVDGAGIARCVHRTGRDTGTLTPVAWGLIWLKVRVRPLTITRSGPSESDACMCRLPVPELLLFNSKLRDECRNAKRFLSIGVAKCKTEASPALRLFREKEGNKPKP